MIIRKVSVNEVKDLRDLAYNTFIDSFGHLNKPTDIAIYVKKAFNLEQVEKELKNPESDFYFIEKENKILGYLKLNIGSAQCEDFGNDYLEIERIYILPDYQKMKVGQKLLEKAVEIAKLKNKKSLWLGVWDRNIKAINFYKKHGFKEFSSHKFMLGMDEQTDLLMERFV